VSSSRFEALVSRLGSRSVFVASFLIRALYGLVFHPPLESLRSDMLAYAARAARLAAEPWVPEPSAVFYPWGTHYLVAAARVASFGHPGPAITLLYAAYGAAAAAYSFASARIVLVGAPRVQFALGILFVAYPTWIALGGFVLSEPPFTACVAASTYYALRLATADRSKGTGLSSLGLGVALAVGTAIRPQMLLSIACFALLCVRRPRPVAPPLRSWAALVAPLLLVVLVSMARMKFHTGEYGFVSKNGALNLAFGRCHAWKISSTKPKESYSPPSLRGLALYEEKHGMKPFPELDPAEGEELVLPGPIWDEDASRALAERCVAETGWWRQVKYSLAHLVLLFAYGVAFPLKGTFLIVVSIVASILLAPAYVAALVRAFARRPIAERVLVAHVLALTVTAAVFFGEVRLRVPYDGVLATLSALYSTRFVAWRRARRTKLEPDAARTDSRATEAA